jgi:hypothetical protein
MLYKDETEASASNENLDSDSQQQPVVSERNKFWNISNDEHYSPKVVLQDGTAVTGATAAATAATSSKHVSTALVLQHTQAALELNTYLFPTHLSNHKLRNFHRYPLRIFNLSPDSMSIVRSVLKKFTPTLERPQFQLNFSSMLL